MTEAAQMELAALARLDAAVGPVGSAALAEALTRGGKPMAQATAGRYLQRLEAAGLIRSAGAKLGRVITEAGRRRLAELRERSRQGEHGARVLQAAEASEPDDLLDLLLVRRVVEAEAARLAAIRATDAELDRIADAAANHVHDVGAGGDTVEPSRNLHRLIAEASHNRLLMAVALLLLDPANDPLAKALARIADAAGETLDQAADHLALAAALRRRDPAAAEAAMRGHMTKLSRAVEAHRRAPAATARLAEDDHHTTGEMPSP